MLQPGLRHMHTDWLPRIKRVNYAFWCIYISKVKAPLSIATTLRCRGGATLFTGLLHSTLDPFNLIVQSVKPSGIKYHFFSLWYDLTWDWTLVSWTIGEYSIHSANSLVCIYIYIYIYICTSRILLVLPSIG